MMLIDALAMLLWMSLVFWYFDNGVARVVEVNAPLWSNIYSWFPFSVVEVWQNLATTLTQAHWYAQLHTG